MRKDTAMIEREVAIGTKHGPMAAWVKTFALFERRLRS
jgi:hypothetical protein